MTSIWKLKIWLKRNKTDRKWTKHCRNFCIGRKLFFSRILSKSFLGKFCYTFGPYLSPQLNFFAKILWFFFEKFHLRDGNFGGYVPYGCTYRNFWHIFFGPYIGSSSPQVSLLYHKNRQSYTVVRFWCTIHRPLQFRVPMIYRISSII